MAQSEKIVDVIRASGLVEPEVLDKAVDLARASSQNDALLRLLVHWGQLTRWHARQLKSGQAKGFFLGEY